MIYLYSGTPGSGKSLHMASNIYWGTKNSNLFFIVNFPVNMDLIKHKENLKVVDNDWITPQNLINFAIEYWGNKPVKEGKIKLYIDEAQILFNARDYQTVYKAGWTKFFSLHRHLGYDIYLVSQFDRMLDRQIRSLIEHEVKHRKAKEMGYGGKFYNFIAFGGLFIAVDYYYPLKQRLSAEFFKYTRLIGKMYDTHALFVLGDAQGVGGSPDQGPRNEAACDPVPVPTNNGQKKSGLMSDKVEKELEDENS